MTEKSEKSNQPLSAIRYSQESKFTAISDMEKELGIQLPDSWSSLGDTLCDAGWSQYTFSLESYPTSESRDDLLGSLQIYKHKSEDLYIVEIKYGDHFEFIVVDGAHNMMALRVLLVPVAQAAAIEDLADRIANAVIRSFMHDHGHELDRNCHVCELISERRGRLNREKARRDKK